MGLTTGGIVIKSKQLPDNNSLLQKIGLVNHEKVGLIQLSEAMSTEFEDVGIMKTDSWILLLNRDLPYSCSFEEELSSMDERLKSLSMNSQVLVFHMHGVSETYCWSLFQNRSRVQVYCKSEGKTIYVFGTDNHEDSSTSQSDEKEVINRIDSVISNSFFHYMLNDPISVDVYKVSANRR